MILSPHRRIIANFGFSFLTFLIIKKGKASYWKPSLFL
ncbi:hypothetical protein ADICYQ_5524 [Cyclobacterium qasimii M12-11B]|uniref:Uncharacterized protein n=1 Tax=Cyclobacterium qasimii M12-11B TaxID=641524 RepID=S7WN32_9BACT|nr:hypothetical protein ADICYQ_5524 [Cyclobacterium qasimii M12-11B]